MYRASLLQSVILGGTKMQTSHTQIRQQWKAHASVALVAILIVGLLTAVQTLRESQITVEAGAISRTPVSIDSLPTVQINGVVWSQAVSGNIVYAGGTFTAARPAGSAVGVNQTTRNNVVAYDITTGVMTSFNPNVNGTVRAVAVAPNGTVYVAGDFIRAQGVTRNRIAAFNPNGTLISTFAPVLDGAVRSLAVTNDIVYAGGSFTTANGVARSRLAAFDAAGGGVVATWDPVSNDQVTAMTLAPDASRVIVGGRFTTIDGTATYGLGAIGTSTGSLLPFAANAVVRNAGANGSITSLSTDGTSIYGTGYDFGSGANFEGTFRADPTTGQITWLEDCHGDTYGAFSQAGAVYTVSHAHDCSTINAFPQKVYWHRALAFTTDPTQTVQHNKVANYTDFFGRPAPSLLSWDPLLDPGSFTGQNQAAWSITGNGNYLTLGGEFPTVNGAAQQGLVRFAARTVAGNPNSHGPELTSTAMTPTLTSPSPGTVRVSFPTNWDRDDGTLTYRVVRDGNLANPVYTVDSASTFWNLPALVYTDTAVSGGTHAYRIYVNDPSGNQAGSPVTSVAVAGGTNSAPTAAFTPTTNGLTVSVNGSGSADPDGSIAGYSWDFGDGGTGTGVTSSRTYAAAGTYTVRLTVTDNGGATGTTTRSVTVSNAVGPVAADAFGRTVTTGFGSADVGGSWAGTTGLSVGGGTGNLNLAAGSGPAAALTTVSAANVNIVVDVAMDKRPAGGSGYIYLDGRRSGTSGYRTRVTVATTGAVTLSLVRVTNNAETTLSTIGAGLTYAAGTTMKVRLSLTGSAPTTLQSKVWPATGTEPTAWTLTASDSTAERQGPGGIGLAGYLSGAATNGPIVLSVDNLSVVAG
jgi:PKD repeat protein